MNKIANDFLVFNDERIGKVVFNAECIKNDQKNLEVAYKCQNDGNNFVIEGVGQVEDKIVITKSENHFICQRTIKNTSGSDILLKEIKVNITGVDLGESDYDYFYCIENPRVYGTYTLPIDYDRINGVDHSGKHNITIDKTWVDPGVVGERILVSPYQPFPAIHVGNYKNKTGLVIGSLSQDVFYNNYSLSHEEEGLSINVYSSFKAISYRVLKAGEELIDKWYFGIIENADDYNKIFDGYVKELRKYIPNTRAKNSTNKNSVIWGSWNDGVYRDVSEEILVKEAKALKQNFKSARWVQLDDGYATYCASDVDLEAHGMGVIYEGEAGVDKNKFPSGLDGYCEKIKQVGLLPAIWVGGFCPCNTKIFKEHPEWFVDYSYRVEETQPLDVSVSEVREYMEYALDTFIRKYGFEGLKIDFWSYSFEDSKDLLKNKEKSGYEYRKWWLSYMRKLLPEHGYMQTGCDVGMGNPFLGEYFDNYRYGLDVGAGDWKKVKTTMLWGCACFSTHVGDMFIPNGDSIGLMEGLNDTDFNFLLNYLLITHSLVEISGLFSNPNANEKRIEVLKKATCGLNNGADVYFANFDYRKNDAFIPNVFYTSTPCFDDKDFNGEILRTVALFNFEESDREISFNIEDIGLEKGEYILTDVWSGEKVVGDGVKVKLCAHGSKMYYVTKA